MIPQTFEQVIDGGFCQYIDGDVQSGTATFCGKLKAPGTVYCEEHQGRCFTVRTVKEISIEPGRFALPEWRPAKALEASIKLRGLG